LAISWMRCITWSLVLRNFERRLQEEYRERRPKKQFRLSLGPRGIIAASARFEFAWELKGFWMKKGVTSMWVWVETSGANGLVSVGIALGATHCTFTAVGRAAQFLAGEGRGEAIRAPHLRSRTKSLKFELNDHLLPKPGLVVLYSDRAAPCDRIERIDGHFSPLACNPFFKPSPIKWTGRSQGVERETNWVDKRTKKNGNKVRPCSSQVVLVLMM
jgi:hypothetical protein